MEPDSHSEDVASPRLDVIGRAHLKEPGDTSHRMHGYEPDATFDGLLQRFWIPVWSVPAGRESAQRVLRHPVCLLVVASDYARFYGPAPGVSITTLAGEGWAVGVSCEPAAGALVAGGSVADFTDRFVDLSEVLGAGGTRLVEQVRAAMAPDPSAPAAHRAAVTAFEDTLRRFLPVDEEGRLVNRMIELVETRADVLRVSQLCAELGLSERSLQRLVRRRIGLTPKWLIRRRRLQEAAERLRLGATSFAAVAVDLGYADQPHLTRDFTAVTGLTPGQFAARYRVDGAPR